MVRRIVSSIVFCTLAAMIGGLGIQAWATSGIRSDFRARVIHVDDGDTVVAMTEDGEKITVRLASIDAPETHKNRCKPGQPFAQKAKDALSDMVLGKSIAFSCHDVDIYDRQVCDLAFNSTTASRELVRMGLAWANVANKRYLRDSAIPDMESRARFAHLGVWSVTDSVAPWEWRNTVWKNTCPSSKSLTQ
ncbi:thermonuclease family protein [Curvibacter sp. APW13]|uniref:thermonuclease family protein n=1 Tax=Curvibacter sp. APW13 TaxID=3077236 RepID=UPI0028E0993A|nr:thermonuclease family protein [Curvibacter sp. APW13]MDT8992746.1 thermonuclease family protein [Curvibacter sp. APW13]